MPTNELHFAEAFETGLAFAGLALLVVLAAAGWVARRQGAKVAQGGALADAGRDPAGAGLAVGWLTLVLVLAAVATLNLGVDPYGMYGSGLTAPVSMQMRRLKAEAYRELAAVPDVVVLGSSVAHAISPSTVRRELGLSAFNAAVGSGRIDDFLLQTKLMSSVGDGRLPQLFLVQVDSRLRAGGTRFAELTPLSQLRFMRPAEAGTALRRRATGLIGAKQTADSLYVLRARSAGRGGNTPNEIDRYGQVTELDRARERPPLGTRRLERRIARHIRRARQRGFPGSCDGLDPAAVRDLDEFLRLVREGGAGVVFYFSPPHPRLRREMLLPSEPYQRCKGQAIDLLRAKANRDEAVSFLDFSDLDSIGGDASGAGYTDPFHLTPANGDRLVAAASETLLGVLERAAESEETDRRR